MKNGLLIVVMLLSVSIVSAQVPDENSTQATTTQETVTTVESTSTVNTTDDPQGFNPQNLYYGGYVNLSFGRVTSVGVAPLVGYKLSPKWSVGTQITYEYYNDKRYEKDISSSNYGFSVFSRYRVTPRLYGHIEFEEMNYELYRTLNDTERKWIPFLYVGGGYSQPISNNMWFTAQVLFDVLQNKNSPYKDWEPFYSIGFGVGF